MSESIKTRKDTTTQLSLYLGKGKEMSLTELPTLRDCLLFGVFLRETDPSFTQKNSSIQDLAKAVLCQIQQRWQMASFKFKPPVTSQEKALVERLVRLWEKATKIAWKHVTSAKEISKFEEQLDKLFDITK